MLAIALAGDLIRLNVEIVGEQLECLLNSGAMHNFVSKAWCLSHGFSV